MSIKMLVLSVAAVASASTLASVTARGPGPALSVNASPEVREWVGAAQRKIDRQLVRTGVKPGSQSVGVQLFVSREGALYRPRLVGSSGSDITDISLMNALNRVAVDTPPPLLSGHSVVFHAAVQPVRYAGLKVGMIR
jgi:hypothetical protein